MMWAGKKAGSWAAGMADMLVAMSVAWMVVESAGEMVL